MQAASADSKVVREEIVASTAAGQQPKSDEDEVQERERKRSDGSDELGEKRFGKEPSRR